MEVFLCLSSSLFLIRFSMIGYARKKMNRWCTVSCACRRDWRCWCKSWRIETPRSSVSSIVLRLSLILSLERFNLSVDIINLCLWSADTCMALDQILIKQERKFQWSVKQKVKKFPFTLAYQLVQTWDILTDNHAGNDCSKSRLKQQACYRRLL